MKKWLIVFAALVFVGFFIRYLVVYEDVYVDLNPDAPITVDAKADSSQIYVRNGLEYEPFVVKGVLVEGFLPGYYDNDFPADEKTYLNWMTLLADMGANTICTHTIMNSAFYNALYRFNTEAETPLYLLQGVSPSDYDQNNGQDAGAFIQKLISDGKRAVDVIHGREYLALGRMGGSGSYTKDVSPWVLGYLLGNEWVGYTVAYTDALHEEETPYVGEFFSVTEDASPFESVLARAMDEITYYESHRYKAQRLITFSNSMVTDPFTYTQTVQMQLDKFAAVDISHIRPGEKVESGLFASYRMYDGMTDFTKCMTNLEQTKYAEMIAKTDPNTIYDGYVQFLNLYHDVPVVITSYGYSTARGIDRKSDDEERSPTSGLTEQEQGEALAQAYRAFREVGCQGAVISSWQDNWARTTWNTMFSVDEEREIYWLDAQTVYSSYGLMAFVPNMDGTATVDGDASEWKETDMISENGSVSLSARYDAGYLYLLVKGIDADAQEPMYVPIDMTPCSGSGSADGFESVQFSRPADFLLVIDQTDQTRLLVQARYDAARMAFSKRIDGTDPFLKATIPAVDSTKFGPIRNVLRVPFDVNLDMIKMTNEERIVHNYYGTVETGLLHHGIADPDDERYDSQADFCFGDHCVEIRIPWQMVNVSDPSRMQIHDDYYAHYGVRNRSVSELYLGLGQTGEITMQPFKLKGFGNRVKYGVRLKQSYYIMQQLWEGAQS